MMPCGWCGRPNPLTPEQIADLPYEVPAHRPQDMPGCSDYCSIDLAMTKPEVPLPHPWFPNWNTTEKGTT